MPEKIIGWVSVTVSFLLTIGAGLFGYGRLNSRVEQNERTIREIKDLFVDSDHNPRLLTIRDHDRSCKVNNELIFKELGQITKRQTDSLARDNEFSSRLRKIEDSTLKMSVSLDRLEKNGAT